ncbi:MAG: hypothetical protein VKP62_15810 [Candidatus Sericytochromatia bacterium]|nr:hypothetical protein [Candidatus Sericytochromatia bacterium]
MNKAVLPLVVMACATALGCTWWPGAAPQGQSRVQLNVDVADLSGSYRLQVAPAQDCVSTAVLENGTSTDILNVDEIGAFTAARLERVDFYSKLSGSSDAPVLVSSVASSALNTVALSVPAASNLDISWKAYHRKDARVTNPAVLVESQYNGTAGGSSTIQVTSPAQGATASKTITIYLANRCYAGQFGSGALQVQTNSAASPTAEHLPAQ